MKRWFIRTSAASFGILLLALWWRQHSGELEDILPSRWGWMAAWLAASSLSMALQWLRTVWLLRVSPASSLLPTVLTAHGLNVFLPSLLGDAYEVATVARQTGRPARQILALLVHRLAATLGALGLLASAALFSIAPNAAFGLTTLSLFGPLLVDALIPRLARYLGTSPPPALGSGLSLAHLGLALLQHVISAGAVFCLGAAIGRGIGPLTAAAMLSVADLMTYLPVPLAGVGLHHWSVEGVAHLLGEIPAALIALNHAMMVLFGGACLASGLAISRQSVHNG